MAIKACQRSAPFTLKTAAFHVYKGLNNNNLYFYGRGFSSGTIKKLSQKWAVFSSAFSNSMAKTKKPLQILGKTVFKNSNTIPFKETDEVYVGVHGTLKKVIIEQAEKSGIVEQRGKEVYFAQKTLGGIEIAADFGRNRYWAFPLKEIVVVELVTQANVRINSAFRTLYFNNKPGDPPIYIAEIKELNEEYLQYMTLSPFKQTFPGRVIAGTQAGCQAVKKLNIDVVEEKEETNTK